MSWQFYSLVTFYIVITVIALFQKWQLGLLLIVFLLVSIIFIIYNSTSFLTGINIISSRLVKNIEETKEFTYQATPLAILIYDEDFRFMWGNRSMLDLISEADPIGLTLDQMDPQFTNILDSHNEWRVQTFANKYYKVYHAKENQTIYFLDIDHEYQIEEESKYHHVVMGYLFLEDYDEVVQSMEDQEVANFDANLIRQLNEWASQNDIYIKRIEEDKFLLLLNLYHLEMLENTQFKEIDTIRQFYYEKNIPISFSIGIAYSNDRKNQLTRLAKEAQINLDLALGRGGDQIVVKEGDSPARFYGGDSDLTERRTNTRSKLVYQALINQINQASNVLISGHKVPDLDSIASALGIYKLVHEAKKTAKIIFDETSMNQDIQYLLDSPQISYNVKNIFVNPDKASEYLSQKTLIILVDHHRPSLSEAEAILGQGANIVVIDHHRRSEEFPLNTVLTYIEPAASSTAELVTEFFINERNAKEPLNRFEATALLAGIVIDTNNFSARTGSRTFDAASYLKSRGADMEQIQRFLKEDLSIIKRRNRLIERTQIYRDIYAISFGDNESILDTVTAAQAADALLGLSGVEASFVVYRRSEETIGISARSLGSVNVQKMMERLGGGGHLSNAATQIKNQSVDQAIDELKKLLDEVSGGLS
ncbi:TPA: DHH family phosphoesterase [Streptococcus suis]